jgi:stage V sporulation protein S
MNRFFSKLDLRDIKIDPEGSRFPPDADEQEHIEEAAEAVLPVAAVEATEPVVEDHQESPLIEVTTWESATFTSNGHAEPAPIAPVIQPEIEQETVPVEPSYAIEGIIVGADGEVLKVSARSRPSAVAGAIAGVVREAGRAEVQAIGAGATNQAVKAVAIARDYLRETGIDAVCLPAFIDVTIENEDRTAIRLVVEPR